MIDRMIGLAEHGRLPDGLIRFGIRGLLRKRLREEESKTDPAGFLAGLRSGPVAVETDRANEQHYEVPTAFFREVLGPRMKYSSCFWPEGCADLAQAEEAMLALTCERAQLRDGMDLLELGCGWGSLTLWLAEHYPGSRITAVSNSRTQREFIESACRERGFSNVTVITADMNVFRPEGLFDRILSVEMFEHMRNVEELMRRIRGWLKPDGELFVHIFCHRRFSYLFETSGQADWMARYFFTGGMMPSENLLGELDHGLSLEQRWRVNGGHYAKTLLAWLERMDVRRDVVEPLFRETYGQDWRRWFGRWRIFFLASAGLFGYRGGEEWYVCHYRFRR